MKPSDFFPNTTQVPNIIFDKFMAGLSGSELKVLLFFIRQRYGFQKFSGQFSYAIKQICEGIKLDNGTVICNGTGLSNRHVVKAIKSLHEKWNLITVKSGDWQSKKSNKYVLTIDDQSSLNEKPIDEQGSLNEKPIDDQRSLNEKPIDDQRSLSIDDQRSPISMTKGHYQETKKKPIETNTVTTVTATETKKENPLWLWLYEYKKKQHLLPTDSRGKTIFFKSAKKHCDEILCQVDDQYARRVFLWAMEKDDFWRNQDVMPHHWSKIHAAYKGKKKGRLM